MLIRNKLRIHGKLSIEKIWKPAVTIERNKREQTENETVINNGREQLENETLENDKRE